MANVKFGKGLKDKILASTPDPNMIYFAEDTQEIYKGNNSGELDNYSTPPPIKITYSELVNLKDNAKLIPNRRYQITDYSLTLATKSYRQVANHVFDIIVKALSESILDENAKAAYHEGDTYFQNSNLDAWELKYTIDNDWNYSGTKNVYDINGKGIIYYMKDEFNNECGFDFKNLLTNPKLVSTTVINNFLSQYGSSSTVDLNQFFYTFSRVMSDGTIKDASLDLKCNHNEIQYVSRTASLYNYVDLPNVALISNSESGEIYQNHLKNFTTQTFICSNTIGSVYTNQNSNCMIISSAPDKKINSLNLNFNNNLFIRIDSNTIAATLNQVFDTAILSRIFCSELNAVSNCIFKSNIDVSKLTYILNSSIENAIVDDDLSYFSDVQIKQIQHSIIKYMYNINALGTKIQYCNGLFIRDLVIDSGISITYSTLNQFIGSKLSLPSEKTDHLIVLRYAYIHGLLYANVILDHPNSSTTTSKYVSYINIDPSVIGTTTELTPITITSDDQIRRTYVYKLDGQIYFKYSNEAEPMFWEEYE